jgi:hypothetical protein
MNIDKKRIQNILLNMLPILICFVFLGLNILTPLIADDYAYSMLGKNGEHTQSIFDIFSALHSYYFKWGGRCVAHFFAWFWLFVGKSFFNIANTMIYCMFVLSIQFHSTGSLKKIKPLFFLGVSIALWFLTPTWGQNFLWLDGSCNYLWTITIVFLFLVPFRKRNDNNLYKMNPILSILFLFFGVLAGWTNENSSAAVLFLLIAYFIMKIIKKEQVIAFELCGGIGFLVGFIVLIVAPGNMGRLNSYEWASHLFNQNGLDIGVLKYRFHNLTQIFIHKNGLLLLILSVVIGVYNYFYQKEKLNLFTWFYFLAGLISVYSMLLSPFFPDRAYFVTIVFF